PRRRGYHQPALPRGTSTPPPRVRQLRMGRMSEREIERLRQHVRWDGHLARVIWWGTSAGAILACTALWQCLGRGVALAVLVSLLVAAQVASLRLLVCRRCWIGCWMARLLRDSGILALAALEGDSLPEARRLAAALLLDLRSCPGEVTPAAPKAGRGD